MLFLRAGEARLFALEERPDDGGITDLDEVPEREPTPPTPPDEGGGAAPAGITHLGRNWELRHSLWIGWALTTFGFLGWVGLLYAGVRARKRSWVAWGALYSLPWIPTAAFSKSNETLSSIAVALLFILGIASTVHAFAIRREYLRRLAQRQARPLPWT